MPNNFLFPWVFDDLFFFGRCFLYITSRTKDGYMASATRLPQGSIDTADAEGPVWFGKSKEIYLVIEDGGPGLTESAYGEGIRSLQRFERSRSRETGGSGLGMSIMSAVVALHKGELSLRKSPLGGLAIHIRLPMTR